MLATALLNLSDELSGSDPAPQRGRGGPAAVDLARRTGQRNSLAVGIANLFVALLDLGEWDAAHAELATAVGQDGLGDQEVIRICEGWLDGLRGNADQANAVLAYADRGSGQREPPGPGSRSSSRRLHRGSSQSPRRRACHARAVLTYAGALGYRTEYIRWAWPLAALAARLLGDLSAEEELVAMLDAHPIGHLPPLLRAERQLAKACAAAESGESVAATALADAVDALRQVASPYHLAHGLLDQAAHMTRTGDHQGASAAIDEAHAIASRLGCAPLAERADAIAGQLTRTA